MTDAQKKVLINKLKSNKDFDPRYSEDNRKWFIGKIIDFHLSKGVPDAAVEAKTNDTIKASGVELAARIKKGFSSGSLPNKWSLYDQLISRTQIIYGMIAMHPQFLDAANASYFDFILERRFRSIQRMAFYVNPNKVRNVFDYPGSDPPEKMKVNKDAASFWSGARDNTLPFVLNSSGKSDPVTADEKLFNKHIGSNRNLFACDPVVMALHMDALRVAKDPDKLLKALASLGDHYLKIDNPLGHLANYLDGQRLVAITTSAPKTVGSDVELSVGKIGMILTLSKAQLTIPLLTTNAFTPIQGVFFMIVQGDNREAFIIKEANPVNKTIRAASFKKSFKEGAKIYVIRKDFPFYSTLPFHFVTDNRPDHALFEQLTIKASDLQVGDHIFVLNHPLYRLYYPTGAWGGEHSFVMEIGSRDSASSTFRTTLKVAGHGLNNTLLGMGDEMLEWNNIVLATLQSLTRIHLDYLKTNGRKSTAKVKFITRKEDKIDVNVFEYSVPYTYSVVLNGKSKSVTKTKGFVIKERVSSPDSAFLVFNNDGTNSILDPQNPPEVFLVVVFIGANSSEQFTLSRWAVPYYNAQTTSLETHPLFENDNKTTKMLTFDDLVKSKPFFLTDDTGDVYVTRPRVDFNAAYQTFLKNIGAI